MKVTFDGKTYEFRPWKPAKGRVFTRTFSFDCETTLIDEAHPWITPAYVIGAAFDGKRGYFIRREDVAAFSKAHADVPVVMHNAAFDLAVIDLLAPKLDIYEKVEKKLAWDTQLLHRLYALGTEGHVAGGKDESTLETCADVYLEVQLPKDVKDSKGNLVRLSYGQWLNKPPEQIEVIYLEYLAKDVIATRKVYRVLRRRLDELLARSHKVWGFVSPEWLAEQIKKWGPQTHHIQLRASIVLKQITANGLHLDAARRDKLAAHLELKLTRQRKWLAKHGYLPGEKGCNKTLQAIFRRLERQGRGERFPRTEKNFYATSEEALMDLADTVPFIKLYLAYKETEKLLHSFVGKMAKPVLHPSFNVLAKSGRTTSFGEINAQNLPKDSRVRSCFIPSPGCVFIDADAKQIELVMLAQACVGQFGLDSKMAAKINAGKDLHKLVSGRVFDKPENELTKAERTKAKPINFGKPGGMGNTKLKQYAKVSYGVQLTDDEVQELSDAWFELFPEMRDFLTDVIDTPFELAKFLDLTVESHHEHTDDARFLYHAQGLEQNPSRTLGCMCLKVLKEAAPKTEKGKPYSTTDIEYFWARLEAKASSFALKFQQDIVQRRPSVNLQREVMSLVSRAGVFTFTGRLRANATYSARHNTIFQGLAADAAKLGLWRLWRAGYHIVNFVHDQNVVEVSANSDLKKHAEKISSLMIAGIKDVAPDILAEVEYAAADRWYKEAEPVFDKSGKKLLLWHPPKTKEKANATV
jgi:DNA polymerase I-like protein with 3'-5' exonuclease and polymerase domains